MVNYKTLYHIMVDGAENAIGAINAQNYGLARKLLIRAERAAEELYVQSADDAEEDTDANA